MLSIYWGFLTAGGIAGTIIVVGGLIHVYEALLKKGDGPHAR